MNTRIEPPNTAGQAFPDRNNLSEAGERMRSSAFCPACKAQNSKFVFQSPEIPVNCSTLWPSRREARNCVRAAIELRLCRCCGLVFSAQFDPQVINYDASYDNSLDFSAAFQNYAKSLADYLVGEHQLHGKKIVEIGCGNGAFLNLLCGLGQNFGKGYDPSHVRDADLVPGVSFVNDYFSPLTEEVSFDLLCCRHVLEHLDRPLDFLVDLARMSAENAGAVYYFEVPNGEFVLKGEGIWDVIYPHVSYFTERSLESLFERAGFQVLQVGKTFSSQFLFIEARRSARASNGTPQQVPERGAILHSEIDAFEMQFSNAVAGWSELIERLIGARKRFAFWGVGAKGVTFLNLVSGAGNIFSVIDSNPRKHHMFVPGTGQIISAPETLRQFQPETVLLLNPAYHQEISSLLSSLQVSASVVTHTDCSALLTS